MNMRAIMPPEGTQEHQVLEHIMKAPLSAMDAFRLYNITDLAGRICRLKEKGWMISRKRCQKLDKRGKEITHWNEYRIITK